MRGEKCLIFDQVAVAGGITPACARGKAEYSSFRRVQAGITPACAGKRQENVQRRILRGDHPRVRGGKVVFYGSFNGDGKDHPRVRGGKAFSGGTESERLGITPRVRGEKSKLHTPL